MLEQARQRARELNQKGALFPWRTINGEEASAYYAAGTAQYHINADIVYGLKKYVQITGDVSLLYSEGAEMLVETARLWFDLGFSPSVRGALLHPRGDRTGRVQYRRQQQRLHQPDGAGESLVRGGNGAQHARAAP
jgi:hypothetical protein